MITLDRPVIVEGRYDKSKLASFIDSPIITTDGFKIFSDPAALKTIRTLSEKNGIIILTDSDRAGFLIRNYIKGAVAGDRIINVYTPDIYGKERRKEKPSKEGKLGVEGISADCLIAAFKKAGVVCGQGEGQKSVITKAYLYELGLSGRADSAALRRALLERIGMPGRLSSNALVPILSARFTRESLAELVSSL